jgi:hypothetical protein
VLPGQDHDTGEGRGGMINEYGAMVELSLVEGNRIKKVMSNK